MMFLMIVSVVYPHNTGGAVYPAEIPGVGLAKVDGGKGVIKTECFYFVQQTAQIFLISHEVGACTSEAQKRSEGCMEGGYPR